MIITPKDHDDLVDLTKRLLDAAGNDPSRVRTSFQGQTMGLEVDDDLARAIGRSPDEVRVNEQPIVRDRVGEVGEAFVLPNVAPGANQAPDVPDSVNERQPHGNDELIKQPTDDSPKVASFGEGVGDVEGQTTAGSTGQDSDRAGVNDAGSAQPDTQQSDTQQSDTQQSDAQSAGDEPAADEQPADEPADEQPTKKSRKK